MAEKSDFEKQIEVSIEKAIGDADLSNDIKAAILEAMADGSAEKTTKVLTKTLIVGSDGKMRILTDDELDEVSLDLGSISGDEEAKLVDADVEVTMMVIGPDGKTTSSNQLDLSENISLNEIIKEALKEFQAEGVSMDSQVISVGPSVRVGSNRQCAACAAAALAEIKEIKEELASQRLLLEQILERLE